ncbi:costars family protein ABRACL-like [Antedon mediterranea]|uniref:costars family protein ABRACL-like n=1 Tax=Antedon mediterranea TaxID=105859 RepID=UPI003AF5FD0F
MNVAHEVELLKEEMKRLGSKNDDGKIVVKFGVLFADDRCANIFEALVGTLRAAKRKKIVKYDGELLLQGVHDNVDIVLLEEA